MKIKFLIFFLSFGLEILSQDYSFWDIFVFVPNYGILSTFETKLLILESKTLNDETNCLAHCIRIDTCFIASFEDNICKLYNDRSNFYLSFQVNGSIYVKKRFKFFLSKLKKQTIIN